MTGKRVTRGKVLTFVTSVALLSALLVPTMGGTANAQFTQGTEPFTVTLSPTQSSASVGTCNPFTVTVTGANGQPVRGQTVTVRLQQNTPPGADLAIGFCVPTATNNPPSGPPQAPDVIAPAPNPVGQNTSCPPPGTNTRQNTNPAATPGPCGNTPTQVTNPPNQNVFTVAMDGTFQASTANGTTGGDPNTGPATVGGSQPGQIYFGVTTSDPGTMSITARVTEPVSGATKSSNTVNKTWTAGGGANATNISCVWDQNGQPAGPQFSGAGTADAQAADSTHAETFTCTVRNASGELVGQANVRYIITSGPDAPAAGAAATNCGNTFQGIGANRGTVQCTVNHTAPNPGTSNITAYVEIGCPGPAGATSCDPNRPDSYEVKATLTKTYQGLPRNISASPTTASNPPGTTHNIVVTVTDLKGNKVAGATVFGDITSGVGRFTAPNSTLCTFTSSRTCGQTDGRGELIFTITTSTNEVGTTNLLFTLNGPQGTNQVNNECAKVAGNPPGSTAGNCTVTATKTWAQPTTPAPHGRSVTAESRRRCHNPPGPRPRRCRGIIKGKVTDLVDSPHAACEAGQQVVVQHKGVTRTPITDSAGNYSASFRGSKRFTNGNYNVSVAGNSTCGPASASAAI